MSFCRLSAADSSGPLLLPEWLKNGWKTYVTKTNCKCYLLKLDLHLQDSLVNWVSPKISPGVQITANSSLVRGAWHTTQWGKSRPNFIGRYHGVGVHLLGRNGNLFCSVHPWIQYTYSYSNNCIGPSGFLECQFYTFLLFHPLWVCAIMCCLGQETSVNFAHN